MSARRAQRVEVVGDLPGEAVEALLVVEEGPPAVAAAQRLQLSSSRIAPR